MAVAGFNAMNRWTGALAIPQEGHRIYLTPTPEKYHRRSESGRAVERRTGDGLRRAADRGPLESSDDVRGGLAACRCADASAAVGRRIGHPSSLPRGLAVGRHAAMGQAARHLLEGGEERDRAGAQLGDEG